MRCRLQMQMQLEIARANISSQILLWLLYEVDVYEVLLEQKLDRKRTSHQDMLTVSDLSCVFRFSVA